jgi:hypothetical protein
MQPFTPEQAAAAVELEQLVAHYWYELDVNGGRNVADFLTADVVYKIGTVVDRKGLADVQAFYAARNARVAREQKGGVRTSRHTHSSNRISFLGPDEAMLQLTAVNYSGSGPPPLMEGAGPTIVSDVKLICRRDAERRWRIAEFYGQPIFVGDDPFQNKQIVTG